MKKLQKFKRPAPEPPSLPAQRKRGQWTLETAEGIVQERIEKLYFIVLPRALFDGQYPRLYWYPYTDKWEVVASVRGKKVVSEFDDRRAAVIEYLAQK